ncbi:hypothetical protein FA15DRAFT_709225 [Coprinopsis marcescibilis]|uniref:Alpha-type protein kinase domain-containing protein n=1 Tax=Coprinopsis marcescibilis TaxID=230819 RepID=A0A5C3KG84_COPMA|nr:hypothetical protein FA15DRAFT_709225 [Coprinopsis marcescibilis]
MRGIAYVNSGKRTDAVIVDIKYRLSGKPKVLADLYGSNVAAFGLDTTLWDIQDCALKHFNLTWTKGGQLPVVVTETILWQQDNGNIDQEMTGAMLQEYVTHLSDTGLSIPPTASSRFGKKKFMYMFSERMEKLSSTNSRVPGSTAESGKGKGKHDRTGSMAYSQAMVAPTSKAAKVRAGGFEFQSSFSLLPQGTSCQQKGINVYKHLRFASLWLLQECGEPSKVSGVSKSGGKDINGTDFGEENAASGFTWLMEERHASGHVVRFSGTLQHAPVHSEISHLMVYAFAHFVLESTNQQVVFADLQVTGDSGIGYHGIPGINSFLEQHECGAICEGLGLTQPGQADLLGNNNTASSKGSSDNSDVNVKITDTAA